MAQAHLVEVSKFVSGESALISLAPVQVRVCKRAGMYFAESELLEIYAFGWTEEEAIKDFNSLVIKYYDHYTDSEYKPSEELAKKAKFYERNFRVTVNDIN